MAEPYEDSDGNLVDYIIVEADTAIAIEIVERGPQGPVGPQGPPGQSADVLTEQFIEEIQTSINFTQQISSYGIQPVSTVYMDGTASVYVHEHGLDKILSVQYTDLDGYTVDIACVNSADRMTTTVSGIAPMHGTLTFR